MSSSFDSEFPHLEINSEEIIQQVGKEICARIFMAVFFYGSTKLEIKLKLNQNLARK